MYRVVAALKKKKIEVVVNAVVLLKLFRLYVGIVALVMVKVRVRCIIRVISGGGVWG